MGGWAVGLAGAQNSVDPFLQVKTYTYPFYYIIVDYLDKLTSMFYNSINIDTNVGVVYRVSTG